MNAVRLWCIVQHKSERDGVIETRIERKIIVTGDEEDEFDHDKVYYRPIILFLQTIFYKQFSVFTCLKFKK